MFDRKADPRELPAGVLELLRDELPFAAIAIDDATGGVSVIDLLVSTGLVKSRGDARRQLQQGAVTVNSRRLAAEELSIAPHEAIHGRFFLVRKGSRDVALAELTGG